MQLKLKQSNKKENAAKTKSNKKENAAKTKTYLEAQTQMVYYSV